jgi:hypothetical protein
MTLSTALAPAHTTHDTRHTTHDTRHTTPMIVTTTRSLLANRDPSLVLPDPPESRRHLAPVLNVASNLIFISNRDLRSRVAEDQHVETNT